MNIASWLTAQFSTRKAVSRYKRGMAKTKKRDHQGAIVDYTTTIEMPETPADLKAMALYYRAVVHVAAGDDLKGVGDLDAILAMEGPLVNVKTMARQKLARMESRSSQS
jgi:hypothetical protein